MELVFTGEFPPMVGGIGRYVHSRCKHPPRDGLRVLAPRSTGAAEWDAASGLDVVRFPFRHGSSLSLRVRQVLWAQAALASQRGLHDLRLVTACHVFPFAWAATRARRRPRVAVFCHGAELMRSMLSRTARLIYRNTMARCDTYICNSPLTADTMIQQGWDRTRIVLIPPTVDASRFVPGLDGSKFRNAWTEHGRWGPVLLTVCRLDDIGKGIDQVLRVVARLRPNYPEIRYVLVGDGPARTTYEAMARELGIAENVIFAGRVSDADLPLCYAACDAFILMSRIVPDVGYYEGFGIVYLEAMACGKPVIVSSEAGFRDFVHDGETGLLVDPKRPDEIERACLDLLRDPTRAAQMGSRAVSFAQRPPDWSPLERLQ